MGFASYFNRDIIALNKRLSSNSDNQIRSILSNHLICIEFDEQITKSREANICIELLIRILCRFYPVITLRSSINEASKYISKLQKLAKSVNSNIEFNDTKKPTLIISAISKSSSQKEIPHIFLGSDGWVAKLSQSQTLTFGDTSNPFGAGMAACIAASNVLRFVFKEQLKQPLDEEVKFSVYDFSRTTDPNISIDEIVLNDVTLVGIGAIGSSTVWTLSKLRKLRGNINLIDHDHVEESNLQRYILLVEKDKKKWKVDIAKKALRQSNLSINPIKNDWAKFVKEFYKEKCSSRIVAVCVDSTEDRVRIQSSLPNKILNAYTDGSRFGISRHPNFNKNVCLACLYVPNAQQRSKLEIIVEELNMKGHEKLIYQYMGTAKRIDHDFLAIFCHKNQISIDQVKEYKNKSFGDFYLEMVCGYKMLEFQEKGQRAEHVDVPLSFQSCMAGLMLAAEIVLESLGVNRENLKDVSQWNVLDKLNEDNPSHYSYIKNVSKQCICGDQDYKEVYELKWGE